MILACALAASKGDKVLYSMDIVKLSWHALTADVEHTPGVRTTVSLNVSTNESRWVGIGFGYDDYQMNGGKKVVVLKTDFPAACSIQYGLLNAGHSVDWVSVDDPWKIKPLCFNSNEDGPVITFMIGSTSLVEIPLNSPMYVLIAFGEGSSVLNHGSNWDYKRIDFSSVSSTSLDDTSLVVDPWLLWHGIVYIVTFCVLMPFTAFLILINRKKFLVTHKVLGIAITALLVFGWAFLSVSGDRRASGNEYADLNSSPVGLSHTPWGLAGKYIAIAVVIFGIVVATVSMSKKVHFFVRLMHGIGGIVIACIGPIVVWNGWVRLAVSRESVLDTTPSVWLIPLLLLVVLFAIEYLRILRNRKSSKYVEMDDIELGDQQGVMSIGDFVALVRKGECVYIFEGLVIQPPIEWVHPGGNSVLDAHVGDDITRIFTSHGHSKFATQMAKDMQIARLNVCSAYDALIGDDDSFERCLIVSIRRVSSNEEFPVVLFVVQVCSFFDEMVVGAKVRVFFNEVSRTYTVGGVDASTKCIHLYIKLYPTGVLTSELGKLNSNDFVSISPIKHTIVRPPREDMKIVCLAAGTGIVPMLAYPDAQVLWWVHSESDLFITDKIKPNVFIGERISQTIVERTVSNLRDCFITMSGPPGFIQAARKAVDGCPNVVSLD